MQKQNLEVKAGSGHLKAKLQTLKQEIYRETRCACMKDELRIYMFKELRMHKRGLWNILQMAYPIVNWLNHSIYHRSVGAWGWLHCWPPHCCHPYPVAPGLQNGGWVHGVDGLPTVDLALGMQQPKRASVHFNWRRLRWEFYHFHRKPTPGGWRSIMFLRQRQMSVQPIRDVRTQGPGNIQWLSLFTACCEQ